jgi:aminoglycoside phosphotransferase (APT) family kinase protein
VGRGDAGRRPSNPGPPIVNLADALSGRAKLEGIRWMLRTGAPRRALRRELEALLPTPDMLGPCHLRYARFAPGAKLRAYYDALVHIEGTEAYRARPVAVTWGSDGDAEWHPGTADCAGTEAEAVRRGVAAPFRRLAADVSTWGMRVQVSPLDAHFPQLVRWSDPSYVCDVVAGAYAASGVPPDPVPARRYAVTSIRYRPGKRHVLRYDSLDTAQPGTVFAKFYHGEKGERVFRVATQVAEWMAEHGAGVMPVKPLAYVAEDAVVLSPRVGGAPLFTRLHRLDQGVARCLRRAGAALHALHHLPAVVVGPLQRYDFAAEIREVERDIAHIPARLPSVGNTMRAILDGLQELHERLPQEPPAFTHRDFKCEHLLVAPGRLTLIDFDRCALADPAFDIGKFLADLQWWFEACDRDGLERAQEQFIAGYAPGESAERLLRAHLYEALELVQMTVLRARLFDQHAAGRTKRLIGRAQAVMRQLRRTVGLTRLVVKRERPVAVSECGAATFSAPRQMPVTNRTRSLTLEPTDAQSERAHLERVRWLLLSPIPRKVMRDRLKALLSARSVLGPCRLRRARFKPGCRLRAHYDALVRMEGTEGFCARPIAVTWRADGNAEWRRGGDDLAEIHAEALRRGVATPFRQLATDVPEWGMHIQVSPLDARFPQLVRLSDPRHVRDMLAAAHTADDRAPDQLRLRGYTVIPVIYHPGQRHVLRYVPLGGANGGTVFAKLHTGEEGARAFRAAKQAADWLAEHGDGVTALRPLAYVAEDGVVLYPGVPGSPLSQHLLRAGPDVARCLERVGAALRALHDLPQAVAGPLPRHFFAAEVSEIAREASDHIPVLLPSVGPALEALLHRALELHGQLPQEPATFTHGDLKSEHVWAAPDGPMLIDFDNACLADPAYDLGKFLADLQLWDITYDRPGLEQAQESFLFGYGHPADAPDGRLLRARLYEAVELVKIARRVPLFAPDWASLSKQAVCCAQAVMNDLERTLGAPATRAYGT